MMPICVECNQEKCVCYERRGGLPVGAVCSPHDYYLMFEEYSFQYFCRGKHVVETQYEYILEIKPETHADGWHGIHMLYHDIMNPDAPTAHHVMWTDDIVFRDKVYKRIAERMNLSALVH